MNTKQVAFSEHSSGEPIFELDIWIPSLNLSFEFQVNERDKGEGICGIPLIRATLYQSPFSPLITRSPATGAVGVGDGVGSGVKKEIR